MIKNLSISGNAWHLYLSKPALQLLRFDPEETKLLLSVSNKILHITKITDEEIKKLVNPLIKNITKKGCGHVIFLSQAILEWIDVNPETDMVDVNIEGESLIVKKA